MEDGVVAVPHAVPEAEEFAGRGVPLGPEIADPDRGAVGLRALTQRGGVFRQRTPREAEIVGAQIVERAEDVAPFQPQVLQRHDDGGRAAGLRHDAGAGMHPAVHAVVAGADDVELDRIVDDRRSGSGGGSCDE